MKLFTIIKNIARYIRRNIKFLNVLLLTNIVVLLFMILSFLGLDYVVLRFERQMLMQGYIWKQEIIELNYVLTKAVIFLTENDQTQMKINKQQQKKIEENKTMVEDNINKSIFQQKRIEDLAEMNKIVKGNIDKLILQKNKILKRLEETKKIDLDNVENIKEANFSICNFTAAINGSGTHIKIGENYYVLTVAHLIEGEKDFVWAVDDSGTRRPLGLVKIDRENDLALFRIYMSEELPYLEISEEYPKEGSEIVVIGNPDYTNDVITEGVITKIIKNHYLFTNLIYFGNSGGAVLYKGKIVGVVSAMDVFAKPEKGNFFILVGSGPNLEIIQEFLKGIE